MLYCPKCQHEYQETGQRFCIDDNSRLVPVGSSQKSISQAGGVFSTILSDVLSFERTERISAPTAEFVRPEIKKQELPQTVTRDFYKTEIEAAPETDTDIPISKPFSRIINPSEIPSGRAELGDRETHPTGRTALSWENPQILIGQTVKGRYSVVEKFQQNESSITYLAEDRLAAGKKVFVCVLMEDGGADETGRDFNDERVSLSHINHPNINRLIDSGSLLEGKSFIISEFIEGTSLKEVLAQNQEFDLMRAARIVRQIANALSVAFQNGILHGNLSPEDIILSINEAGTEQVKVTNFSTSTGGARGENFSYKSPEQLEGKTFSSASDIYSLGIIAYQMLTGRLPFNASTLTEHLRLRREGMTFRPTSFRLDIPFSVDDILKRALAYNPSERYPKARDFGDALYNALVAVAEPEESVKEKKTEAFVSPSELFADEDDDLLSFSELFEEKPQTKSETEPENELKAESLPARDDIQILPSLPVEAATDKSEIVPKIEAKPEETKAPEELAWQKRSIEPVKTGGRNWVIGAAIGMALLFIALWAVWAYFLNRPNEPQTVPVQTATQNEQPANPETEQQIPATEQQNPVVNGETELPPFVARKIEPPPNSVYFENSKENTSKELLKNYRGFSLYYPNNWKKNKAETKFIDVSIDAPNGVPIEQMMISPYVSKGTFSKDREEFPKLVEKSNKDLSEALSGKYEVISEGETTIQNGRWKAYEVKFQASGEIDGKKTTIWGRRLWIPVQRPGAGSGFIITMLASSYSNDIKSVDDVGVKGKLAEILYTFEPETNF